MNAGMNTMGNDEEETTDGMEHQAEGTWNRFAGRVREFYGDVTGDEMEQFKGNMQQAKGWLQQKYGKLEEGIAEFFDEHEEEAKTDRMAA